MRISRFLVVTLASLLALATLAGCAPSRSGDVYRRGEALRAQSVEFGTIESLRNVRLEDARPGVGTAGGAVLGGLAGSTLGGGSRAHAAGAVAGAIIGGIAGHAIERDVNRANGIEVTVRLDSGRMIAVAQEGDGAEFRPGDRVRVLSDGRTTRVTR